MKKPQCIREQNARADKQPEKKEIKALLVLYYSVLLFVVEVIVGTGEKEKDRNSRRPQVTCTVL